MGYQYDMNIYPNPAMNWLTIEFALDNPVKVFIEMVDIRGQSVYSNEHYPSGNHFTEIISLNAIPAGFYILKLRIKDHVIYRKVIVQ